MLPPANVLFCLFFGFWVFLAPHNLKLANSNVWFLLVYDFTLKSTFNLYFAKALKSKYFCYNLYHTHKETEAQHCVDIAPSSVRKGRAEPGLVLILSLVLRPQHGLLFGFSTPYPAQGTISRAPRLMNPLANSVQCLSLSPPLFP